MREQLTHYADRAPHDDGFVCTVGISRTNTSCSTLYPAMQCAVSFTSKPSLSFEKYLLERGLRCPLSLVITGRVRVWGHHMALPTACNT